MFQSSDEINLDEDFLSDAFNVESSGSSTESIKRNSNDFGDQPVKKVCTVSSDRDTNNILAIINCKGRENRDTSKGNVFKCPISNSTPVKSVINLNNSLDKNRRVVQRKFPGPAGILPEQLNINIRTLEDFDTSINNKTLESEEIVLSQFSEDIFRKGPWLRLVEDWCSGNISIKLPDKYTISWIKANASIKKLIGQKTPFLAAVIQNIDCSSRDPMILLKDKTGEIQATLLREVWDEYSEILTPGSVIILKQIGVLSTLKKHYLAITFNNLITIYSEKISNNQCYTQITKIQDTSPVDLKKLIDDTKQKHKTQQILQNIQPQFNNNPYFKTSNNSLVETIKTNPTVSNQFVAPKTVNNQFQNINFVSNSVHKENLNNNVSKKPEIVENKFNFKEKLKNKQSNDTNQSNNLTETRDTNNTENNEILSQVLEGVDTTSLFEDF